MTAALTCTTTLLAVTWLTHAGPLDPPSGAIAPTYKTLSEVEPRIAISATSTPGDATCVFKITQPGSYYLTGNLYSDTGKHAIVITTSNVQLDMRGFNLLSQPGGLSGVQVVPGSENVEIHNGSFAGYRPGGAISAANAGVVARDLLVIGCYPGITVGPYSTIERCVVRNASGGSAFVVGSYGNVINCSSIGTGNSTGITLSGTGARVIGCTVAPCTIAGIMITGTNNTVIDTQVGVQQNNSTGIVVQSNQNVLRDNTLLGVGTGTQTGLSVSGQNNIISGNIVKGCSDNYQFANEINQLDLIISQLPESLDVPCTARLITSLTGVAGFPGITINASGVTLDLGGNEIVGPGNQGILAVGTRSNVTVRNGGIRGFSQAGINLNSCVSPRISGITSTGNGASGIATMGGSVVNCTAANNVAYGIYAVDASVIDCTATGNGQIGMFSPNGTPFIRCNSSKNMGDNFRVDMNCQIKDCIANYSTNGNGINANSTSNTIVGCTANGNAAAGVRGSARTRIEGCTLSSNMLGAQLSGSGSIERCTIIGNVGGGIAVDGNGQVVVRDNEIAEHQNNNAVGIRVLAPFCHVEGNRLSSCYRSIEVGSNNNLIVRNTSTNALGGGDYVFGAGNSFGKIVSVVGVGDIGAVTNANQTQVNLIH
jgi:hypothetical protein